MNRPSIHPLYQLLPAIYRERDHDGQELAALLTTIGTELDGLEANIGDLYESWFIETCPDWVVPYIGDLLGIRGIGSQNGAVYPFTGYGVQESRAYVANTLAYRRRKGTAPLLEQLVRDVTGWRARGVEFFGHLALTQNLNHLRQDNQTINLRATDTLRLLGTPFEQKVAYSGELRQITSSAGKYNPTNLGLFLWRLQSYPLTKGTAHLVSQVEDNLHGCSYTFSPLARETRRPIPLFNPPQPETEITQTAGEINLPVQLRTDPAFKGYRGESPAFQIYINGRPNPIPAEEVLITKLGKPQQTSEPSSPDWQLPSTQAETFPLSTTGKPRPNAVVAVDPALGRMVFLDQPPPTQVEVTYAYGFSADMGGGPYDRSDTIVQIPPESLPQSSDLFFSPLYWEVKDAYSSGCAPLAEAAQTWNGTAQAWQGCYDLTLIPLAHVEVPKAMVTQASLSPGERPQYQAGVVWGMEIVATPGTPEIVITPGLAVDDQGRPIQINQNSLIKLDEITPPLPINQPLWVMVSYWADRLEASYQLSVVPQSQAKAYAQGTYLRLASFSLMTDSTQGKKVGAISQPQARDFRPGIVEGLTVITPPDVLEAIVTPGVAVDGTGRVIRVDTKLPLDLREHQDQVIWVAIAATEFPPTEIWPVRILTEADAGNKSPDRYLHLARLRVPSVRITRLDITTHPLRPTFAPGIVTGLVVEAEGGDRSVTLTAGRAVDDNGQAIIVERPYRVRGLGRYRGETITLAIAHGQEVLGPNWILKILKANDVLEAGYLPLARLSIGLTGGLSAEPLSLSSPFKPGVVKGSLAVTYADASHIKVEQGKAIDRLGNLITLAQPYKIDLRRYPGRAFLLFISHQKGQGWKPLAAQDIAQDIATEKTVRPTWPHLGLVPELPAHWKEQPPRTGVIVIQDNHTYTGDLHFEIPNSERLQLNLQILAADHCRPHLRGNLSLRGLVKPEARRSPKFEPGNCLIDGLLIEGHLTVQPGDLKHVVLRNSTLVPGTDHSLRVEATTDFQSLRNPPEDGGDGDHQGTQEDTAGVGFLLLILSTLWLIVQLLKLAFDGRHLSAQQRLKELTQYLLTELEKIWCAFREELYQFQRSTLASAETTEACPLIDWLCGEADQETGNGDNADLQLTVDRSILGAIYLAPSVPNLAVWDSIIDAGPRTSETQAPGRALAIIAQGTRLDIQRSTLLGSTLTRRLEASTSIFTGVVSVVDRQGGCLRFCYVPLGSQTPLRYRCQPDLALAELSSLPGAITAFCINPANHQPFLGTAGQGILRLSADSHQAGSEPSGRWKPTNLTDKFITAIASDQRRDGQTIFFAATQEKDLFRWTAEQTDWQPTQPPPIQTYITTLLTHSRPLTGTITSDGTTVTGEGTRFETELHPGDTITVLLGSDENSIREVSRTIVSIESQQALTLDDDFEGNLSSGTSFRLRIWLAGTAGEGVWRFSETGSTWIRIHDMLAVQHITTLVIDSQGLIYAGTPAGVFRFRWSKQQQSWQAVRQGLAQHQVTALMVDADNRLFAGTADGVIFRSIDRGRHWVAVWQQTTGIKITSLAVQPITGQGEVNNTTLVTSLDRARYLKPGNAITIGEQTRSLINDPQTSPDPGTLFLDAEFCPALPETVTFTSQFLFAGTASGILRSLNNGDSWEFITIGNTAQQITALAVDPERFTLWAGTMLGSVFSSHTAGERWETVNQGLKNVDKVYAILRDLHPTFTTADYGQPGYGQLDQHCLPEICQGAEDGVEMGAFNILKQSQREANLGTLLNEYLRFGLQAGIFYVT